MRAFYRQIVRGNRIPMNFSYEETNRDPLESIHEADAIIAKGGPGYKSAEEMFSAMGTQMLEVSFSSRFERDVKTLIQKRYDIRLLKEVIELVSEDTEDL